ncbi:hypothetical protein Pfo_003900 [Paulownia fortunei]|nr:hypothetical protein Pfo_003900 [Paulownia fortunei]
MGSSEKVDSGRFSGGRSNFSQTCSLLSQYLKEKGSFGDLSLGLTPKLAEPKGTMNLLPMIEKSGQNSGSGNFNMQMNMLPQLAAGGEETLSKFESGTKSATETAQMTIFYAGQVIVFNDFPADKAKEIMMLASKSSAAQNPHPAAFAPPYAAQKLAESATSTPNIVPTFGMQERARHPPQPALGSDLPIARKNSLARFLEKRKDRITANAPYQASKPAPPPPKAAKTEAWLGLASQPPLQIQRH